jgi:diguanylate cyclase (GGDEF)-like protein/PAS domain S-box-containing protein
LSSYRDITEYKQTEKILHELSLLTRQQPNPVVRVNVDGYLTYINQAAMKLWGETKLLEKTIGEIIPACKAVDLSECIASGIVLTLSGEVNGRYFQFHLNGNSETNAVYIYGSDITERRRAEQKMQQQKELLESTIESLAHPFYVVDISDYTVTMANSATTHDYSLGCTTCHELIHQQDVPCDKAGYICPITTVRETKNPLTVEHVYYDKNGNVRNIEIHAHPIFNDEGEVVQMIEYVLDITERKHAEANIRTTSQRLQTIIEMVGEGITLSNERGHFEIFNSKMEGITGYTKDEANSHSNFLTVLHPNPMDWQAVLDGIKELMQVGYREVETTIRDKNGNSKILLVATTLMQQSNQNWFLSSYRDITERKQAEKALRKSENRYRELVESQDDLLVCRWMPDTTLTFVNHAFCRFFGKSKRKLIGSLYMSLIQSDEARKSATELVESLCEHPRTVTYEHKVYVSEELYWLRWVHQPIQDIDGHLLEFQSFGIDITERKKAEETLHRLATMDGLTQVANRRSFDEYINQTWQEMQNIQAPLSLILCDIDYFKPYNDRYGHQMGDDCLRQVARAISQAITNQQDFVARYGGEEFVVILPNTNLEGAAQIAEKIQTELKTLEIVHGESDISDYVTLSMGIACTVPRQGVTTESLVKMADEALYEAKDQGRDRIVIVW